MTLHTMCFFPGVRVCVCVSIHYMGVCVCGVSASAGNLILCTFDLETAHSPVMYHVL